MFRLFLLIILSTVSSLALADVPTFFHPAEEDLSLYYLGAIYGSHMIPGGTDMFLMSHIFEIFNAVCLSVGMVICTYTVIAGVLHTASSGKPLGEKWDAVWMPMRMVLGMALLVPKAGTGYCLAQFGVMWLTVQGVGAADTLWVKILDYFIEGGTIYSTTTGKSGSYMNKSNVDNTYALEREILINEACLAAHNESEYKDVYGEYKIYNDDDYYFVNFGNQKAWENGTGGQECGYIKMPEVDPSVPVDEARLIRQTYNNAFMNMSDGLKRMGKFFASEDGGVATKWPNYRLDVQTHAVTFINYLQGASDILFPDQNSNDQEDRKKLEELKKYGWILVGNYYMTLSSYSDAVTGIKIIIPDLLVVTPSFGNPSYDEAMKNAQSFWYSDIPEEQPYTFTAWPDEEKYNIPGYVDEYSEDGLNHENYGVNKDDLKQIQTSLKGLADIEGWENGDFGNIPGFSMFGQQIMPEIDVDLTGLDTSGMTPQHYMDQITGFGEAHTPDPILRAAKYGKKLTMLSVMIFGAALSAYMTLISVAVVPCLGSCAMMIAVFTMLTAPLVFGVATFLYVQGAMLGVFLPLIPFVIFLVSALGWFFSVLELMTSAPLIALGIVFPEANSDIMGKAEPAFMMILNLFLRPSLMVIGFMAGMILTWIAIELLNAAFYLFIKDAAQIENYLFGFIVLTTTYAALLIYVVGKTFSLTSDLPNKVLQILGDKSQAQEGGAEIVGAARTGHEKGSGSVATGMSTAGGATEKAAQFLKNKDKKKDDGTNIIAT